VIKAERAGGIENTLTHPAKNFNVYATILFSEGTPGE